MDPIVIFAGFVLFAVVVYLVGYPLFRKEEALDPDWETMGRLSADGVSKDVLFTTLAEIEFDYQMGKMGEEDYQELKETYEPQAIKALQAEEKLVLKRRSSSGEKAVEQELAEELERELAELRRQAQNKG